MNENFWLLKWMFMIMLPFETIIEMYENFWLLKWMFMIMLPFETIIVIGLIYMCFNE